jgi:hypothetical protein
VRVSPGGRSKPQDLPCTALAAVAFIAAVLVATGDAHKPITSPFTFNEHVFPILRDRCSSCHVAGGVAPMPLTTHPETVPWGESIRLELIAGHMPPWTAESSAGRLRRAGGLSARELNTLLTWASGGTPAGDDANAPAAVMLDRRWPLGAPDVEFPLPAFTLKADTQEHSAVFTVATGERALRAIDLRPGTPAIVRSATIATRSGTVLAWWQPGDAPMALDAAAFHLPAQAELVVTIRYRKTWEYERKEMTDQSSVGLYRADAGLPAVSALTVEPGGLTVDRDVRLLAITPAPALDATDVRLDAAAPDGSRHVLLAFRPRAGWTRRYWFDEAVPLPRGTRLVATPGARLVLDVAP